MGNYLATMLFDILKERTWVMSTALPVAADLTKIRKGDVTRMVKTGRKREVQKKEKREERKKNRMTGRRRADEVDGDRNRKRGCNSLQIS